MAKGLLVVISGFSGVGKGTVIQMVLDALPNLKFSVSCTTRKPRQGEENGVNYFFLTEEEFEEKIARGEFVEYTRTFTNYYGTLKSQVESQLAKGENVVLDVDVKGGCNVKQFFGDRALSLFIQPPSIDELRRRLVGRGTDAPEVIEDRIARAEFELTFAECFDKVIVNDDLERAVGEALAAVEEFVK